MLLDLAGKSFLVTGANTGIGRITALELARCGARVTLAGRSEEKTAPVIDKIRRQHGAASADFLALDLDDLRAVRRAAFTFLERGTPLDVLINNAGVAGRRGVTAQGFEAAFGVNHLGPFLFTTLLLERLAHSRPARIVNVSSIAHFRPRGLDFNAFRRPTVTRSGVREYEVSKLCNVLFTKECARRVGARGVHSYAVHPGTVASDIWREVPWPVRPLIKLFMCSNEEGAQTTLYCASSSEVAAHDGRYYEKCREKPASDVAEDAELAARLWTVSEEWTRAA